MVDIVGIAPRAPSVYGRAYIGEKDLVLDLIHNTFRRCYFRDCEIIIPDTTRSIISNGLLQCQFDDCEITIIKRAVLDSPENQAARNPKQLKETPIACHIDVKVQRGADKNLITCRLDNAVKEKLGMSKTIQILKYLAAHGKEFSGRYR
jgi:hypothetical protein